MSASLAAGSQSPSVVAFRRMRISVSDMDSTSTGLERQRLPNSELLRFRERSAEAPQVPEPLRRAPLPNVPTHEHGRPVPVAPLTEGPARALEAAIELSRALTAGNEQDPEAPVAAKAAWERATGFLRAQGTLAARYGAPLPIPRIGHGPDSSIDLLWRVGSMEILVNFPVEPGDASAFYGDDRGQNVIRGCIASDATPVLLPWLVRW